MAVKNKNTKMYPTLARYSVVRSRDYECNTYPRKCDCTAKSVYFFVKTQCNFAEINVSLKKRAL